VDRVSGFRVTRRFIPVAPFRGLLGPIALITLLLHTLCRLHLHTLCTLLLLPTLSTLLLHALSTQLLRTKYIALYEHCSLLYSCAARKYNRSISNLR
jgi:hypothetical protein